LPWTWFEERVLWQVCTLGYSEDETWSVKPYCFAGVVVGAADTGYSMWQNA